MSKAIVKSKKLVFSKKAEAEFKDILKRYPDKRSCIMATLYLVQTEFGWMSPQVMEFVSLKLEVPISQVWELVTFYTMYHRKPVGKFHLQVCKTLSCELNGCKSLLQFLKDKYQLKNGETSADGLFTLTEVECLGACDKAPVMQVNDNYYENLDVMKLEKVLEVLKEKK